MRRGVVLAMVAGCRFAFDPGGGDGSVVDASDANALDGSVMDDSFSADGSLTPDAAMLQCPGTYQPLGSLPHRYRQLGATMAWMTGVNTCASDMPGRTHMVVIDEQAELDALLPFTPDLWIGISDAAVEDQWVTVLGVPASFLPWAPGQPASGSAQNCGELEPDGLHDNTCTNARQIICECE